MCPWKNQYILTLATVIVENQVSCILRHIIVDFESICRDITKCLRNLDTHAIIGDCPLLTALERCTTTIFRQKSPSQAECVRLLSTDCCCSSCTLDSTLDSIKWNSVNQLWTFSAVSTSLLECGCKQCWVINIINYNSLLINYVNCQF